MFITNEEIAHQFYELAELLEIEDTDRFRVSAYRNAAIMLENLTEPVALMIERGYDLTTLRTVGKDIAEKIQEIARTGELSMLEDLVQSMPADLIELSRIPGVGAKRVKAIKDKIKPLSADQIYLAAERGELARLPSIGQKIQSVILAHFKRPSHEKPVTR